MLRQDIKVDLLVTMPPRIHKIIEAAGRSTRIVKLNEV
jgi:hypothetical protein